MTSCTAPCATVVAIHHPCLYDCIIYFCHFNGFFYVFLVKMFERKIKLFYLL
jgi:hypothetical protein